MAVNPNVNPGALFYNPNATGYDSNNPVTGLQVADGSGNFPQSGKVLGDSTFRLQPASAGGVAAATGNPTDAQTKADTIAYLQDQAGQLNQLLGRTNTNLTQGLQNNEDAYNTGVGTTNAAHDQQVTAQNKAKLGAYDAINQNANTGYRSLAQIIGRASGTGSSAFQQLLPNVIGTDTSSKRLNATNTFGQNLSNIDAGTQASLADLLKQKKTNEDTIRTGVENSRQGIQGELATNAGQLAQAQGGGFAAVKAAQQPFQDAINNSRNTVENFFSQFRTPYTPLPVDPNLAAYSTDRSAVNAQNSGGNVDASNPYAALLRKKLQGA